MRIGFIVWSSVAEVDVTPLKNFQHIVYHLRFQVSCAAWTMASYSRHRLHTIHTHAKTPSTLWQITQSACCLCNWNHFPHEIETVAGYSVDEVCAFELSHFNYFSYDYVRIRGKLVLECERCLFQCTHKTRHSVVISPSDNIYMVWLSWKCNDNKSKHTHTHTQTWK